jgi:hypothetical protein
LGETWGRARVVVWVLEIKAPLGSWTVMGDKVGMAGKPAVEEAKRKWPVVPVSAIAVVADVTREQECGGGELGN